MDAVENARILSSGPGRTPPETTPAEAARQFEAYLLHQMLKTATRPIAGRHLLDGGSSGRMFRDLFLEEVSRLAVEGRGLGVVRSLDSPEASGGDGDRAADAAAKESR
ncbi:MAG: hypothetical protein ACQGVK_01775 [Myxococcota bacterium]